MPSGPRTASARCTGREHTTPRTAACRWRAAADSAVSRCRCWPHQPTQPTASALLHSPTLRSVSARDVLLRSNGLLLVAVAPLFGAVAPVT